jgi:hypothetical protein
MTRPRDLVTALRRFEQIERAEFERRGCPLPAKDRGPPEGTLGRFADSAVPRQFAISAVRPDGIQKRRTTIGQRIQSMLLGCFLRSG